MCGEDERKRRTKNPPMGRSPRVRGRREASIWRKVMMGSIPACAGKTPGDEPPAKRERVDPRVCGEDTLRQCKYIAAKGRSPRVRGRLEVDEFDFADDRSIPACAGKTVCASTGRKRDRVDPRVCGEDRTTHMALHKDEGRSPRVRGRPFLLDLLQAFFGSIPACAGKTP